MLYFFKGGGNDMTYEYDPHEIDVWFHWKGTKAMKLG